MEKPTAWGLMLKTIRLECKISQHRLSRISGVDRGIIRRVESGKTIGKIDVMEILLWHLGHDLDVISRI
jgi:transcriptional regulator with XRE-family HTH domain